MRGFYKNPFPPFSCEFLVNFCFYTFSCIYDLYTRTEMQQDKEKHIKQEAAWGTSFVMKLWLEQGNQEGPPDWRWRVRHIQSGDESYFRNMSAMLKFIEEKSRLMPPS